LLAASGRSRSRTAKRQAAGRATTLAGQLDVGGLLLLQRLLELLGVSQVLGEGGAAVAGDFVALHTLTSADQGGVEHVGLDLFLEQLAVRRCRDRASRSRSSRVFIFLGGGS
jgi:hypothetical protein